MSSPGHAGRPVYIFNVPGGIADVRMRRPDLKIGHSSLARVTDAHKLDPQFKDQRD